MATAARPAERERLEALLRRTGWLARCPAEFQQAVLGAAQWRRWDRDQVMWLAGSDTRGLIAIADGLAGGTTALAEAGVPMGYVLRPGFWTGDYTVLTGEAPRLNIIARTPVCGVIVPAVALDRLLAEQPIWWRWVGLLGSGASLMMTMLAADLMRPESRIRVAAILLHISGARLAPMTHPVETPGLSQEELAAMCALNRHTVRKVLVEFEGRGWISTGYRWLRVNDAEALRALLSFD